MQTELETLAFGEYPIEKCPAFTAIFGDPEVCGQPLVVKVYREVRGDDFGEFTNYGVGFACGHTVADMQDGLRMAEYV